MADEGKAAEGLLRSSSEQPIIEARTHSQQVVRAYEIAAYAAHTSTLRLFLFEDQLARLISLLGT
jgi:hypothetical protein